MENNTQELYQDSPSSSLSSTPIPSSRSPPVKPLPPLPLDTPTEPLEPYRDEPSPSSPTPEPVIASPAPQRQHTSTSNAQLQRAEVQLFFTPYTDAPRTTNDEDVPLAQLNLYPIEAPPPYQVAVRESYRDTLVQHIPNHSVSPVQDEEAGIERIQADDVRFTVEKIVATIIVSMLLLIIASLLALIAVSGFNWKI